MNWDDLAEAANAQLSTAFGETVTYSRSGNQTLNPVEPFEITAIPHLALQYQGHNAPTHALQINVADVESGPQRGDKVVWQSVTWSVVTVDPPMPPYREGTALLGIRRSE